VRISEVVSRVQRQPLIDRTISHLVIQGSAYTRIVKPHSGVCERLHCWATFSPCPSSNEAWKFLWADNIWDTSDQRRTFQRYNNFDIFTFVLVLYVVAVICVIWAVRGVGVGEQMALQYFST